VTGLVFVVGPCKSTSLRIAFADHLLGRKGTWSRVKGANKTSSLCEAPIHAISSISDRVQVYCYNGSQTQPTHAWGRLGGLSFNNHTKLFLYI